jgi:predicted transposase/invertase (TIGR01784 family)
MEEKRDNDDYDSPWKTALDNYFHEFMRMYFTEAAAAIDWARGYESLDTELPSLARDAALGKRFADKLVKVYLKSGAVKLVYIHIEVQGAREAGFEKRMFVYNYRIQDRFNLPVASFAVLADTSPGWRPDSYRSEVLGCRIGFDFPVAKLLDHLDNIDSLLASDNPFAIVTAAHLLTCQSKDDASTRYRYKQRVVKLLYEKGWEKQEVLDLFAIIDWMMHLPQSLTEQFRTYLVKTEQELKMRYVTSVERLARDEGKLEGKLEGRTEEQREIARRMIAEGVNIELVSRVTGLALKELKSWVN